LKATHIVLRLAIGGPLLPQERSSEFPVPAGVIRLRWSYGGTSRSAATVSYSGEGWSDV